MPNTWNFGWSYYVLNILIMLTYIPGGARQGLGACCGQGLLQVFG